MDVTLEHLPEHRTATFEHAQEVRRRKGETGDNRAGAVKVRGSITGSGECFATCQYNVMVKSEDFDLRADPAERFGGGQMTVGEGQMVFWEGTNCQNKSIISMQRHRHT